VRSRSQTEPHEPPQRTPRKPSVRSRSQTEPHEPPQRTPRKPSVRSRSQTEPHEPPQRTPRKPSVRSRSQTEPHEPPQRTPRKPSVRSRSLSDISLASLGIVVAQRLPSGASAPRPFSPPGTAQLPQASRLPSLLVSRSLRSLGHSSLARTVAHGGATARASRTLLVGFPMLCGGARLLAWCRQAPASRRRARDARGADRAKRVSRRVRRLGRGVAAVRSRCGGGAWRTERARAARGRAQRGRVAEQALSEARAAASAEGILLSGRERAEGFRGVRGGCWGGVRECAEGFRGVRGGCWGGVRECAEGFRGGAVVVERFALAPAVSCRRNDFTTPPSHHGL
jgi:hypothetical protein